MQQSPPNTPFLFVFSFLFAIFLMISGPGTAEPGELERVSDQDLISKVDRAELERIVRDLSGANEIEVWGLPLRLSTRYAFTLGKEIACQYLVDEIREIGYEPVLQRFALRVRRPALTALTISGGGDSVFVGDIYGRVFSATSSDDFQQYDMLGELDGEIYDLEIDSIADPPGTIWAACGLSGGGFGAVFGSSDGGRTWVEEHSGSQVLTLHTITMSGDRGIAAGSSGTVVLAISVFGEVYWSSLDPAMFGYRSIFGSASSGEGHFWLAGTGGLLYEMEDSGADWVSHDLTATTFHDIDFYDSRRGVVVGNQIVFYTVNGGDTWTEAAVDVELRCVRMADSLRVLAGGIVGSIWISEDGGASWNELIGACPTDEDAVAVTGYGADRFWIAGGNDVRMLDIGPPSFCTVVELTDTIMGKNISFFHEGVDSPDQRIILSAHYDSYSSTDPEVCAPGADDNATGVAAVLESARALYGERTGKTVEFVLFDGEELGLRGSRYFAANLDTNVSYEAVINLDMLGYDYDTDRSFVIAGREDSYEDSTLAAMIVETTAALGIELYPYFVPGAPLSSDHMAFWSMGFPSILLIEGNRGEL
ncbi:MAG: M20/M25/M40 family metallo-hydrolase, partial [Candidatus Krumholzibacteria bacterium]|nr:M20/M25/M40 family metallo-hydrolase [Candidatus Krumholzibacteria bacterium]